MRKKTLSVDENAKILITGLLAKGQPPAPFEYLGSGCSRNAYLGPDGLVYKVDNHVQTFGRWKASGQIPKDEEFVFDEAQSAYSGNLSEWSVYQEWVERGIGSDKFRLAETQLVMVGPVAVLVAERITPSDSDYASRGDRNTCEKMAKQAVKHAYLWPKDFHGGNWGIKDGCYVVLDYGHWTMAPGIDWAAYDAFVALVKRVAERGLVPIYGNYNRRGNWQHEEEVLVMH